MSRIDLKICLQNQKFLPGCPIMGTVEVTNSGDKVIEVNEVYINLWGQEFIKFKISSCAPYCCFFGVGCVYRCTETTTYEDGVTIVDETITLLDRALLPKGRHSFPFEFMLEEGCPSTFETKLGLGGHVQYGLKAFLKVPGKAKYTDSCGIRVEGILDIRKFNQNGPLCVQQANKKVDVKVQLPKTGYLSGERIPVKVTITNLKGSSGNAEIAIVKRVELVSRKYGKSSKEDITLVNSKTWNWASGEWLDNLELPMCTPTNLCGAECIAVDYFVQVNVKGVDVFVPIVIGAIASAEENSWAGSPDGYQGVENYTYED
ncbi:arrestin domain-containing protein 1 [Folsomia candida]|uniref:arrestin domain-containing protein 1 n=1 Tax=Folsomia candida TaxID=158441 RepID=UPI000B9026F1|nr:arrestin domain-containing protein 1 [Folsomia candida]